MFLKHPMEETLRFPALGWTGDPLAALPQRVAERVRAQDLASERLIFKAQMALVAGFAVLYAVAPRPDDAAMNLLAPIPVAMMVYTGFTAIRLLLSRRGPIPEWLVAPSIVADIALLLGLIWSFHIEYGAEPPLSLKVPAFAYLFVFIALRALRFHHRYVLTAGLAAAAGWALLTVAVVLSSPPDVLTMSFAEYVNGGKILLAAEAARILAILLVTALLAMAARRAQTTLIAAVREEAAAKEIGRFLSLGVAQKISRSENLIEAGQAMERDAAILFLDIRGFTPFAARVAPSEVVRVLTGFHARITPIVRGNGGVIDKFLGDGVMATFGAVEHSATAAADALRALEAVLAEARAWRDEAPPGGPAAGLEVNGAAAHGRVVFAAVGGGGRLEYTVIGEAVNLAAKLEKHNKAEGTRALTTEAMRRAAVAQGYATARLYRAISGARVAGAGETMNLAAVTE